MHAHRLVTGYKQFPTTPSRRLANARFVGSSKHRMSLSLLCISAMEVCMCGQHIDAYGDHAFACVKDGVFVHRHIALRDGLKGIPKDLNLIIRTELSSWLQICNADEDKRGSSNLGYPVGGISYAPGCPILWWHLNQEWSAMLQARRRSVHNRAWQ